MRVLAFLCLAAGLALTHGAEAATMMRNVEATAQIPRGSDMLAARIRARLTPRGTQWVRTEATRLRQGTIQPGQVEADASSAGPGLISGVPAGGDAAELAFIVLMQANADAEQDLRSIMDDVKRTNAQKQEQRNAVQAAHSAGRTSSADCKDCLGDMSQMLQMRLRLTMDRRSKFIETLSNIMKKIETTDETISQNLK